MRSSLLLFALSTAMLGQDRYVMMNKGMDVCPRAERDDERISRYNAFAGQLSWQTGTRYYNPSERKDVHEFAVVEKSGKTQTMSEFHGKPVLIGLWSVGCEPSLAMLGEMAQLQDKAEKLGFEVFPVNFDRMRWAAIEPFLNQEKVKKMLPSVKIFTPGLGENGVNQFMDVIPALPTFFILDRQGRVAIRSFGYKRGNLVSCLKAILSEPSNPADPIPSPSEKPNEPDSAPASNDTHP